MIWSNTSKALCAERLKPYNALQCANKGFSPQSDPILSSPDNLHLFMVFNSRGAQKMKTVYDQWPCLSSLAAVTALSAADTQLQRTAATPSGRLCLKSVS